MKPPVKNHWLDRAIEVYNFHVKQCKEDDSWTIPKTAIVLNRSLGSVSQDILLARWSLTHEKRLRKMSYGDALEFVREKKKEMNQREI